MLRHGVTGLRVGQCPASLRGSRFDGAFGGELGEVGAVVELGQHLPRRLLVLDHDVPDAHHAEVGRRRFVASLGVGGGDPSTCGPGGLQVEHELEDVVRELTQRAVGAERRVDGFPLGVGHRLAGGGEVLLARRRRDEHVEHAAPGVAGHAAGGDVLLDPRGLGVGREDGQRVLEVVARDLGAVDAGGGVVVAERPAAGECDRTERDQE